MIAAKVFLQASKLPRFCSLTEDQGLQSFQNIDDFDLVSRSPWGATDLIPPVVLLQLRMSARCPEYSVPFVTIPFPSRPSRPSIATIPS
jgi:hypothetical protein